MSGRNWGAAAVQGSTLVFSVGSRPAFRVPLKDVGGVQQAAQEVCNSRNFRTSRVCGESTSSMACTVWTPRSRLRT